MLYKNNINPGSGESIVILTLGLCATSVALNAVAEAGDSLLAMFARNTGWIVFVTAVARVPREVSLRVTRGAGRLMVSLQQEVFFVIERRRSPRGGVFSVTTETGLIRHAAV